jgi:phosphopantothenoylcysteine decarboxylase / phosphopantothenate---cysteine ligase
MARVLLGVTGGIAAYKACELARRLVLAGHEVFPIVTRGAERFVTRETFAALTHHSVDESPYPHLTKADLLVVAPLTANTLAKFAHGLADDVLSEAALAHRGPILVAPAMNTGMWEHPATQANVETLRSRGVELVGPAEGGLAEGETGMGRMAEPEEIFARCEELLGGKNGSLEGRRILVTAGGTREPLDAVRYLGNRSSGRMGVALAEEARRRGAEVTLVASNLSVAAPRGVDVVQAPTAADVEREVGARADGADIVLMTAAVADYRPAEALPNKRPKDERPWPLDLQPTPDVLRELSTRRRNGQVLVAFGADQGEAGLDRKRQMLTDKDVDLVVYNDVGREDIGFDSADNEVVLVRRDGERRVDKASKASIAAAILDEVETLVGG